MLLLSQQRHDGAMPDTGSRADPLDRVDECGQDSASRATLVTAGALLALAVLLAMLAPEGHAHDAVVLGSNLPSSPLRG